VGKKAESSRGPKHRQMSRMSTDTDAMSLHAHIVALQACCLSTSNRCRRPTALRQAFMCTAKSAYCSRFRTIGGEKHCAPGMRTCGHTASQGFPVMRRAHMRVSSAVTCGAPSAQLKRSARSKFASGMEVRHGVDADQIHAWQSTCLRLCNVHPCNH
jgi:hypothetical protein